MKLLLAVCAVGIGAAITVYYYIAQIGGDTKAEMAASGGAASTLFSVVYVTVPSADVGKRIAREIVRRRLAACVNIVPRLTSVYEWKGAVTEDEESLLIIKTGRQRLEALREAVTKMHPYDVPEFVALPIEYGSEPYLRWVLDQIDPTTAAEEKEEAAAAEEGGPKGGGIKN